MCVPESMCVYRLCEFVCANVCTNVCARVCVCVCVCVRMRGRESTTCTGSCVLLV